MSTESEPLSTDLCQQMVPVQGQAVERKNAIEYLVTQLEEMEKEEKQVIDATTQFWESVVQAEQLEQFNTYFEDEEGKIATLRTSLR